MLFIHLMLCATSKLWRFGCPWEYLQNYACQRHLLISLLLNVREPQTLRYEGGERIEIDKEKLEAAEQCRGKNGGEGKLFFLTDHGVDCMCLKGTVWLCQNYARTVRACSWSADCMFILDIYILEIICLQVVWSEFLFCIFYQRSQTVISRMFNSSETGNRPKLLFV